jgi:hypothetical protein
MTLRLQAVRTFAEHEKRKQVYRIRLDNAFSEWGYGQYFFLLPSAVLDICSRHNAALRVANTATWSIGNIYQRHLLILAHCLLFLLASLRCVVQLFNPIELLWLPSTES